MKAEVLVGMVLGTCTLQKLIGQGGMGAVYLAEQSRPRRQVAVKVLLPPTRLTSQQQVSFLERFRRETDTAASLEHPNILPVHEYGERDGLAYLVMPYISGGTLRDMLEREGKLPLVKIVTYLDQLAAAIDCAHERGVIHRDIKPANILMTNDGRLLLTDFGLVKIIGDGQVQQPSLTGAGIPAGTPDYMAPEQAIGGQVDARTDLYSLGVILYQMVTGETPFKGDLPMQIAMQHLHMPPPPPSLFCEDLPPTAEQVILRALAKRPEDRFECTQDLASAFRLALAVSGIQLETPVGDTASRLFTPRGLFDPRWQTGMVPTVNGNSRKQEIASSGVSIVPTVSTVSTVSSVSSVPATPVAMHNRSMVASVPSRPRFQVGKPGQTNDSVAPVNTSNASDTPVPPTVRMPEISETAKALSSSPTGSVKQTSHTPYPSARSPLRQKTGLLRSFDTPENTENVVETINRNPVGNAAQGVRPTRPLNGPASSYASVNLSPSADPVERQLGAKTRVLEPSSPVPPINPTGTLPSSPLNQSGIQPLTQALGEYQEATSTIKLSQSIRVVQVPVAGQPGRFVTGLLPVLPQDAPTTELPKTSSTDTTSWKHIYANLKVRTKVAMLATAVLLVIVSSSLFLLTRPHNATIVQQRGNTTAHKQAPNLTATAASMATATTVANTILYDPLRENIHNWPATSTGSKTYVFKNGAYYIADNDTKSSATALLPDEILTGSFAYSLTMKETKGDDGSDNNQFGMIFDFSVHQKNNKTSTTFYTFEVLNKNTGQYQFWKYDDDYGAAADPWKMIWSKQFDKEFHAGHDGNATNTLKVLVKGTKFTFTANGKQLGTAEDKTFSSGQIGMFVNLKGTEVTFSNLRLSFS